MRSIRLLAAGASALALVASACSTGGAPSPTTAPAAPPTTAPAKPVAAPSPSPAAATSPAPAASAKPAASPAASPAVAVASPSAVAAGGPKPTVKVGSFNFDESEILQELYAQVLETNGYTIERHTRLGNREIVEPALESGQIDLVPEYLATVEAFVAGKANTPSKASSDPAATQTALQALLTPKNITVLDFAKAVDTNGFVVTKATADKFKLTKMSDLQPVATQLVLGGPPECPQRPFCQLGLQQTYGLNFKDFKPLDAGGPLTVTALTSDPAQIDVGLLFTTDPNITVKNLVLLDDDKHLQLADNIAPVVRNAILTAGSDAKTLLNSVTAKLTTADLTTMNNDVGNNHKDASAVSKAYLMSKGLIK